jgi:hypothetical protein
MTGTWITLAAHGRRIGRSISSRVGRSLPIEEEAMKKSSLRIRLAVGLAGIVFIGVMTAPVLAHHSFAMYDQTKTRTLTGKLTRYIPGSNHAQLIFELVGPDGKPVIENGKPAQWGVETSSAANLARQGVTVESFPVGTIFTVTLYPLRDGRPFGAVHGPLIKCGNTMPAGGCTEQTGQVLKEN